MYIQSVPTNLIKNISALFGCILWYFKPFIYSFITSFSLFFPFEFLEFLSIILSFPLLSWKYIIFVCCNGYLDNTKKFTCSQIWVSSGSERSSISWRTKGLLSKKMLEFSLLSDALVLCDLWWRWFKKSLLCSRDPQKTEIVLYLGTNSILSESRSKTELLKKQEPFMLFAIVDV